MILITREINVCLPGYASLHHERIRVSPRRDVRVQIRRDLATWGVRLAGSKLAQYDHRANISDDMSIKEYSQD